MRVRLTFAALGRLIRETFLQANASGIGAMMVTVTAVCSLLCLSVVVSGDVALHDAEGAVYFLPPPTPRSAPPAPGERTASQAQTDLARDEGIETVGGRVSLAFGAVTFPIHRERRDAVRFLEAVLGGGVAGTLGLLMALVWTSGFVPSFLEPGAASVLLVKPVARRSLLFGKYVSVLAFVGFHVSLFVVSTWLALGVRTGVWDRAYLTCIPLLLLQFAVFYSFSVLLAVVTRGTVACAFGSVLYWLLSWGINYGSVIIRSLPEPLAPPAASVALTDAAYWVSPKPIDATSIFFNALDVDEHFEKPPVLKRLEADPSFSPRNSVLSSLVLAGTLLALAAHEFESTDY